MEPSKTGMASPPVHVPKHVACHTGVIYSSLHATTRLRLEIYLQLNLFTNAQVRIGWVEIKVVKLDSDGETSL